MRVALIGARAILKHMTSALFLSLALLGAEPALAGGPHGHVAEARSETVAFSQTCTQLYGLQSCRREAHQSAHVHTDVEAHGTQAAQTVVLSDGFFAAGLTGGVERPGPVYYGYRTYGRGVVILGIGHGPQSAGQAAAARGLPRG